MKRLAILLFAMLCAGAMFGQNKQSSNRTGSKRNGELWNPDGIELVYVKGSGRIKSFYIGKYEVTQAQWKTIKGDNPSVFKGDSLPVETVSWDDAQEFIEKLNARTGRNYKLPTEAEWEYAARGGNKSRNYKYSGSNSISVVAWYDDNSGRTTHTVGTKQPNVLGIYDMSGNVWEWCEDWSDSSQMYRVMRGSGWNTRAQYCHVTFRNRRTPDYRSNYIGIRLSLVP